MSDDRKIPDDREARLASRDRPAVEDVDRRRPSERTPFRLVFGSTDGPFVATFVANGVVIPRVYEIALVPGPDLPQ